MTVNPNWSCPGGVHHAASVPAWPSGSRSFRRNRCPGKPGKPRPAELQSQATLAAAPPAPGECELPAPGQPRGLLAEPGTARGARLRDPGPPPPLRPRAPLSLPSSGGTGSWRHAVGVGDRAGFRSRGGVSRGAQNILRTQKSAPEEQVSGDSWKEARRTVGYPLASHPGA